MGPRPTVAGKWTCTVRSAVYGMCFNGAAITTLADVHSEPIGQPQHITSLTETTLQWSRTPDRRVESRLDGLVEL